MVIVSANEMVTVCECVGDFVVMVGVERPSQRRPVVVHCLQKGHVSSQRIRRSLSVPAWLVWGPQFWLLAMDIYDHGRTYLHVRQPVLDFVCALLPIVSHRLESR
jgi:hypothetical protein